MQGGTHVGIRIGQSPKAAHCWVEILEEFSRLWVRLEQVFKWKGCVTFRVEIEGVWEQVEQGSYGQDNGRRWGWTKR